MFALALSPEFWATCKIEFTDENGRSVPGAFGVKFKRLDVPTIQERRREILDKTASGEIKSGGDPEFLQGVVTGFRDIEIPANFNGGKPIAADEVDAMLDYLCRAGLASAMVIAFNRELPRARAKN